MILVRSSCARGARSPRREPWRIATTAACLLAALLEAAVKLRRRAWQDREVVLDPDSWTDFADRGVTADEELEQAEAEEDASVS